MLAQEAAAATAETALPSSELAFPFEQGEYCWLRKDKFMFRLQQYFHFSFYFSARKGKIIKISQAFNQKNNFNNKSKLVYDIFFLCGILRM